MKILIAIWYFSIVSPDGHAKNYTVLGRQNHLSPNSCNVEAMSFERQAKRLAEAIGSSGVLTSRVVCEPVKGTGV